MTRLARWIGLLTAGVVLFVAPATVAHGLWSATATGTLSVATVSHGAPSDPPTAPTALTQPLSDCGTGALAWGMGTEVTGFRVYRRVGGSAPYTYTLLADVTTKNATFSRGSMPASITVVVTAYDSGGESAYSTPLSMNLTCPSAPVLSCGTNQGPNTYRMIFVPVGDATAPYRIHTSTDNATYSFKATSPTSPYSTTITSDGTSYWRIQSSNGLVTSVFSNTLRIVRSNGGGTFTCQGVTP